VRPEDFKNDSIISMRIPPFVKEALKDAAKRRHMGLSEYVRLVLKAESMRIKRRRSNANY